MSASPLLALLVAALGQAATAERPPLVSTPPAAVAPGPARVLSLHPGEVLVFRLATAVETPGLIILRSGAVAKDDRLAPGELRAALTASASGQSLLTVENANPVFVGYQAVMTLPDGASVPTPVCTLLPDAKPSYEHWPHPVVAITLFGFHKADDSTLACG